MGYLLSNDKKECFGCEACVQVCSKSAIQMFEDEEGFRYPKIDASKCTHCHMCEKVCPLDKPIKNATLEKYTFGGYSLDAETRFESTSGGAFSAIVNAYCDKNYVIFGAEADGLNIYHRYITDKSEIARFRKSKYSQSVIGNSFALAKKFLNEGKKVLFSGTPCQIAGLKTFLGGVNQEKLLTVEVICEGVPSPLYMRKLDRHFEKKYGAKIKELDYRYTGKSLLGRLRWGFECIKIRLLGGGAKEIVFNNHGKWDFQIERIQLMNDKVITVDRWFNPFWSIWLKHLMSRPSCYSCPFAKSDREADITLGDLWGVHLYCPELYGNNGGSSLVVCNTDKGKRAFLEAQKEMYGHELSFADALKYQSPMRKCIDSNPCRTEFMADLQSDEYDYKRLTKKWATRPTMKLFLSKYVWGNRQKVFFWNLSHKFKKFMHVC